MRIPRYRLRAGTVDSTDSTYTLQTLEPRLLLSAVSASELQQLLSSITTTGSDAEVRLPTEVVTEENPDGEAGISTTTSLGLIKLTDMQGDNRYSHLDGSGYSVVVLDTGIDLDHSYWGADADGNGIADRIVYNYDFVNNDGDASDGNNHGSNCTSIIASEGAHPGLAPGVDIISLKVLNDSGSGSFSYIESALQWVVNNAEAYNVAAVNMSLGDSQNLSASGSHRGLGDEIASLAAMDVIVVSAAGNDFYSHGSEQGASYPSVDPNSLCVGAVYDSGSSSWSYGSGAKAYSSGADRITPFSQRHETLTDIFAPGAPIIGASGSGGTCVMHGTSQAAPHVAGAAVLAQQLAVEQLGRRLTVSEFADLMRSTGVSVTDGDDEDDNVTNTGVTWKRLDMLALAEAIDAMGGPETSGRFDFGTADSPLASGYTRVSPATTYSAEQGYGWTDGSLDSRNRPDGTDITRDFCFSGDATFAADLASDTYQVKITLGDMAYSFRDNMRIYLEGQLVDTVTTWTGITHTGVYTVNVADQQLNVRLVDDEGLSQIVCINELVALPRGPQVTEASVADVTTNVLSSITLTFNEAIDADDFTPADVLGFSGPMGAITVTDVVKLSDTQYRLDFAEQSAAGSYQLVLGTGITDANDNPMDQDGDGTGGEMADRYTLSFEIVSTDFDFGTAESPIASGYTPVTAETAYDARAGYGWQAGTIQGRNRATGSDELRDFCFNDDGTFAVDLANGVYEVQVALGESEYHFRDSMGVYMEGSLVDTVTTWTGHTHQQWYTVTVEDGQLNVRFLDGGGISDIVSLQALRVRPASLVVASRTPETYVAGSTGSVTLTFNRAVDESTLTAGKVLSFSGPSGALSVNAVTRLSATDYRITFDSVSDVGTYWMTLSSNIQDLYGAYLDTDGDGREGETVQDRYTLQFDVHDWLFDFGLADSPTPAGYIPISPESQYLDDAAYGWTAGDLDARDRGLGTDLTRDFCFSGDATFEVAVPNDTYAVTVTLGDMAYSFRDDMQVYLEGELAGSATTWTGITRTATYTTTVADGKLTLRILDGGGISDIVCINSMEIAAIAPYVVSATPDQTRVHKVSSATITFSEAIDPASFTADDVTIQTPGGAISPTGITRLLDHQYRIDLPTQSAVGDYQITLAATITDTSGNPLDQDRDGQAGEATDDRYSFGFSIAARSFDFGTAGSPVETGYLQVTTDTSYSSGTGFGFSAGTLDSRDRAIGSDDGLRDFVFARDATFLVDLPNGDYDVTVSLGDLAYSFRDDMRVYLEDSLAGTVTTWTGIVNTSTYRTTVSDGQLTIRFYDPDGISEIVCVNALDIAAVEGSAASAGSSMDAPASEPILQPAPELTAQPIEAAAAYEPIAWVEPTVTVTGSTEPADTATVPAPAGSGEPAAALTSDVPIAPATMPALAAALAERAAQRPATPTAASDALASAPKAAVPEAAPARPAAVIEATPAAPAALALAPAAARPGAAADPSASGAGATAAAAEAVSAQAEADELGPQTLAPVDADGEVFDLLESLPELALAA